MSNELKELPKSFTLGGVEYKIEEVDAIADDSLGTIYYGPKKIYIAKNQYGIAMTNFVNREQVLYHEVVHAILYEMGEHRLCHNEKFVQTFSLLMHQFEKTKK